MGGLVSVGQQAFVGLGAYALFACVTLAGIDPVIAIPLAGCFAAVVAAAVGPLLFRLEGPILPSAAGLWRKRYDWSARNSNRWVAAPGCRCPMRPWST